MNTYAVSADELLKRAINGDSFLELVEFVHSDGLYLCYSRGLVMHSFREAFQLSALDFTTIVFACEIFGDGATVSLEATERMFREKLLKLGILK